MSRSSWRSRPFIAVVLLALASCGPPAPGPAGAPAARADAAAPAVPAFLADTIAAIRADYAPDRRVARFDVEASRENGRLTLTGATDQPAAMERLAAALAAHEVDFDDRVRRLPDEAVGDERWALANNSVANLRSEPRHPAELATQVPLGTPLRVLDRDSGWLLVQAPDGYIAWVDGGGVERLTAAELDAHRRADRVVYLPWTGVARAEPRPDAAPVADLVAGGVLVRVGAVAGETTGEASDFERVRFPDGREAWVPASETAPYREWTDSVRATEPALVATARTLLGRPYLWGGTSPKGMDCSGFTKTVFLAHGLVLPRDASQQVHAGVQVDDSGDFDALRPGDLLFFGRPATDSTAERVVHVGMWIGDGRFIHSSERVRISSVDPADRLYDPYNVGRYLRARRMLGGPAVHPLGAALYPTDGRFLPTSTSGAAVRKARR